MLQQHTKANPTVSEVMARPAGMFLAPKVSCDEERGLIEQQVNAAMKAVVDAYPMLAGVGCQVVATLKAELVIIWEDEANGFYLVDTGRLRDFPDRVAVVPFSDYGYQAFGVAWDALSAENPGVAYDYFTLPGGK
jgi:hypothetical protein